MVRKARLEELEYLKSTCMYEYAPFSECVKVAGKPAIGTRWIDTSKGETAYSNYRLRLVAR